jgi:hypothetical protein
MNQLRGSCLCGEVTYTAPSKPLQVVACHCALCRKLTGAALSVYVVSRTEYFQVDDPSSQLRRHQVTERTSRSFCGVCGSPLFNQNPSSYPGLTMLYLGSTDSPELHEPAIQIFCESRLPWLEQASLGREFRRFPSDA